MPHKSRESIDEQQMQSGMTAEELTDRIFQTTYDCANEIFESEDIEMGYEITDKHKTKAVILINQFKSDICKDFHKWYCVEHRYVVTSPFTTDEIVNEYLNAPEPE